MSGTFLWYCLFCCTILLYILSLFIKSYSAIVFQVGSTSFTAVLNNKVLAKVLLILKCFRLNESRTVTLVVSRPLRWSKVLN